MALISCPECGAQVSSSASACPNCAYPICEGKTGHGKGNHTFGHGVAEAFVWLVIICVLIMIMNNCEYIPGIG